MAQENELMVRENYDLSTAKQKFQQTSSYKEVELELKNRQIKVLQTEKYDLKKEIDRLQKQHMQHVEKERTLLNLQQMVQTLKEKNDDITEKREHFKNKMHEEVKHNSPRRSTSIPKYSRINNPKYKSPKKKTHT